MSKNPPPPPPPSGSSSLGAKAFATGSEVHFTGPAGSTSGKSLMSHELTHVVQQGSSPSAIPASHTLQTKGLTGKGASEVVGGAVPSHAADRAVLRSMAVPPAPPLPKGK